MKYRKVEGAGISGRGRRGPGWMLAALLAFAAATSATVGGAVAAGHDMPKQAVGHAAMDPAAMDRHFEAMMGKILPDLTLEQKTRLRENVRAFHAGMQALHAGSGKAHAQLLDLVQQPRIDRAAIEAVRVEHMRRADAASVRMAKALADAAETLTPDQRVRLIGQMKMHMH
jgi:Spy/CpxP family protein refolding chaperone